MAEVPYLASDQYTGPWVVLKQFAKTETAKGAAADWMVKTLRLSVTHIVPSHVYIVSGKLADTADAVMRLRFDSSGWGCTTVGTTAVGSKNK